MIREERCARYAMRQTTHFDTWFFPVYLLFIVVVFCTSVLFFRRHTIDELNLWIEMENHKKIPNRVYRIKWERVTQYRNAMNEHFYVLSRKKNTFWDRTFFCTTYECHFQSREKEANKKDYLLLCCFFLRSSVTTYASLAINVRYEQIGMERRKKLIEIWWLKAKL